MSLINITSVVEHGKNKKILIKKIKITDAVKHSIIYLQF